MTVFTNENGKYVSYEVDTRWAIDFKDVPKNGTFCFTLKDGKGTDIEMPIECLHQIIA